MNNKKFSINGEEAVELWSECLKDKIAKERKDFPILSRSEFDMMTWLLFQKSDEFRVWMIKKCDKRAIKQLIQERETQRQGIPLKMSTIHLRRMNFIKELINSKFNAAEAARRCGYSQKYAKQVAYRIRRSLY